MPKELRKPVYLHSQEFPPRTKKETISLAKEILKTKSPVAKGWNFTIFETPDHYRINYFVKI